MSDLNGVNLGLIKRLGNRLDVIEAVLMADRVHSIAKRDVLDVELGCLRIESHAATLPRIRSAIFSAVLSAAEVMMSRLPAYAGR